MKKDNVQNEKQTGKQHAGSNYPKQNIDKLEQEAEKERGRKPGSQSNQSDRHNTGRGGGK